MPDFWQFPTVSMGLGPMMAIYQARFVRYLEHRGIVPAATARSGLPRRRRDGRAGVAGRDHHAGAREARQPRVRDQLQPAAPRRPGARQRQDHPGARGRVPRRRLERHQGALGLALGSAARARRQGLLRR
jgi:pyruvate dehydrogenase E1 component